MKWKLRIQNATLIDLKAEIDSRVIEPSETLLITMATILVELRSYLTNVQSFKLF